MNNDVTLQKAQQAAKVFEENLAKYPVGVQIAVGLISKNVLNGCSWEITSQAKDVEANMDEFKNLQQCRVTKLTMDNKVGKTPGYLVEMNFKYLCRLLAKEAPGLITERDIAIAKKHRNEAVLSFEKLLKNDNTRRAGKKKVGIYCTNDSQIITVDGIAYPAFALTLAEALMVADVAGYLIMVDGKTYEPSFVLSHGDIFLSDVLKFAEVAPSRNAIFVVFVAK